MIRQTIRHGRKTVPCVLTLLYVVAGFSRTVEASPQLPASGLPELTQPVNDFAHVVDASSAAAIDQMIRTLQAATGDAVVVATVPTIEPYGDIREYANKLFQNHGRGIGQKGRNNGLLILLAVRERKVWIEVGYELEQWITDGYAGETSRLYMVPEFRERRYAGGLRIGAERIIGRIAQGRNISLDGVRVPTRRAPQGAPAIPVGFIVLAIILLLVVTRLGRGPHRGMRSWGRTGGWSSGVGPFGGSFGGGFGGGSGGGFGGGGGGGGGFGGGFGGFGGGSSGGGGGGGSW